VRFLGGAPEAHVLVAAIEEHFFEAASVAVVVSFGAGGVVVVVVVASAVVVAEAVFVGTESVSFLIMLLRALRADGEDEKDDEAEREALDGAEEYRDVIECEKSDASVMAGSVGDGSGDVDDDAKVNIKRFSKTKRNLTKNKIIIKYYKNFKIKN
jgi:hypothetical protein